MIKLIMFKTIRYTYYCEELFVVKHKSKHNCARAIFYDLGPKVVTSNCHFDYIYNMTVPPVILDGEQNLLLANFHGSTSLKCNSENRGLCKPAPEHTNAMADRDLLFDCQLNLEHASVFRQLSTCTGNKSAHLTLHFVVNMGFHQLLHTNKLKLKLY